jgi:hypothetical protein
MIEKRARHDRRCETRHPSAGQLTWRQSGGNQTFTAWLSDTSPTSMSFVTYAKRRVEFGEEIELGGIGDSPQRCRIMRIAPYDHDLSLIACRSINKESELGDAGALSR